MSSETSIYRGIIKGTAIFGGSQFYNILIGIVRGKLVAMILGPAGMGFNVLFSSAISPIQQFSTLGMPLSVVRNISSESDDTQRRKVVKAFRKMLMMASMLGAIVTILFSPVLSRLTFGDEKYTWSFVCLSLVVLFSGLNQGESTILQAYRRLKSLALCSIVGSTSGLLVGIPLYYWFGIDGIVPAMVVLTIVSYVVSLYGTRQIELETGTLSLKEIWSIGRGFLFLGIVMMLAFVLGNIYTYSLNIVIRHLGTISDIGLFQSGNSIVGQYVGMVFAAMGADYYPHLSSVIHDKLKTSQLVCQQGEIVLFVIAPLAVFIIITAPLIIKILLTDEFYMVVDIIRYMGLGVILKAICFPLGYLSLAKGDKVFYFCTDGIWTNIKALCVFTAFYYFMGFHGLGLATFVNSLIDVIVTIPLFKWRFGISYNLKFFVNFISLFSLASLCMVCSFIENIYLSYSLMILLSLFLSYYCYMELNKRIEITELIKNKIKKKMNGMRH